MLAAAPVLAQEPRAVWDISLGSYADKPAVADLDGSGRLQVVVATDQGKVAALGGANGVELWSRTYDGESFHGCPIVADIDGSGRAAVLVAGGINGTIACLDGGDGSEIWRKGPFDGSPGGQAVLAILGDAAQPVPALVVGFEKVLRAFAAADGHLLWETPLPGRSEGSVTVGTLGGQPAILLGTEKGELLCFDAEGHIRWSVDLGERVTKPAVFVEGGGRTVILAVGSGLTCLDSGGHQLWRWVPPTGRGLASGIAVAELTAGSPALVINGYDGQLYALDLAGKPLFKAQIAPAEAGVAPGSTPIALDLTGRGGCDLVLASPRTDQPGLLAFDGRGGRQLWRAPLGRFSQCCPLAADLLGDGGVEVVVAAANNHLAAYRVASRSAGGWVKFGGDPACSGDCNAAREAARSLLAGRLPFAVKARTVAWADKLGQQAVAPSVAPAAAPAQARPASEIAVKLDGQWLALDPAPIEHEGRVLVPMRAIFEAMKAQVVFDAAAQSITATRGAVTVVLKFGAKQATVNGESVKLDAPLQFIGDYSYVPLRFVGQSFGAKVKWVAATKDVEITSG
jgi:outer membrane protein assembly factor BamB